jgi:SAM-dependent methyltransferase
MSKDIYGDALLDYQQNLYTEDLITFSSITEEDIMPLPYLFRSFNEMPMLEQKALNASTGHILDLGAGAGSHALYLQSKNQEVTAIDVSEGAIEVCKQRGINNAFVQDIWTFENKKFDTILALMNGTGICGKLDQLALFLLKLKSLLSSTGQILIDSSDIIYMYENEDGEHWIPGDTDYYGEVAFELSYKKEKGDSFPWLYVDFNTLQRCANFNGLHCELLEEGEHYDYLAKLTIL